MKPIMRMRLKKGVENEKGDRAERGTFQWVQAAFPGPDPKFYNIVTGGHEGAAILIADIHESAFDTRDVFR